jgi:hypothetical protein
MRCRSTRKIPTFNYTLKASALCFGNDIDHFNILEMIYGDCVSALEVMFIRAPYFLGNLLCVNASFRSMTFGAIVCFVGRLPLRVVSDLNG